MVRAVEGIAEFELKNGMRVLLYPDASRPTVTVNVTIFVGSRHEGYGEAGMAHLLEHMVFKGTPDHPTIPAMLQERGAQFNGTTWLDRTNYYETMSASDENLEFAIRMEADRMINSFIKAEDLASEMTVVRNEFESGENSPQQVLMQRVMSGAFEWHNYGKDTIGNRADIERVPVENLRRFYQKFYQPDNAMLIVAGKFSPEKALELSQKYFGSIPRPERKLENTYTEEPAQDGERIVTVRRVGDVPLAAVAYHVPSGGHPDFAAIEVLATVMSSDPSGRLYESLVKRRIAASVAGMPFQLHDPGVLFMMAEAAQGTDGSALLEALIEGVETAAQTPFTPEEIERARQELLRRREIQVSNTSSVAVELSDWAAQGDWRLFFVHRDRLEKVSPEDVQRVANAYLVQTNRTAGLFAPTKTPSRTVIPPTPNLAEMIGDYKGRQEIAQGEEFDVAPSAIEARLERSELKSGLKVTLLPKKTRGNAVELRLTLRYGNLGSLKGRAQAAQFLPEMMMRGTDNMTRQQINDQLDNYRAQLSASGEPGVLTLSLKTTKENLVPVLDIVKDIVRNPAFPESELETLREEQLAAGGQQISEPVAIAANTVQRKISQYPADDPRYVPTLEEELQRVREVTVDQIRSLYKELVSSQTGELTIIGDFDPKTAMPAVDRMTSGWKSTVPFERIPKEAKSNTEGDFAEVKTPDKANAAYFAGMTMPMRDDHPDYPALLIGNSILGGSGLSSRLGDRVRQQDGLSYTVQSMLQPSAVDQRAVFYIFAISNPENARKVHAAIQEELARLIKDGITEKELKDAVAGYLQEQQVRRSNDRGLASMLEAYRFIGRDLAFVTQLEDRVRSLTVEEVNAALQKHIDPNRLYIISAGDFKSE
ncbi:MAG: insulinase family protein [Planctomyces sp.]|nr:insulinase family protein [Planctomyces sp.]